MSSPVFRRLRKQTSSLEETHQFRVAVFGQSGVGKTALTVRFVTRRFIGEYDSTQDKVYQRTCIVPPSFPVFYEILDSAGQEENDEVLTEKILWSDAFIIVYSVTDRVSFDEIVRLRFRITHTCNKKSSSYPDPVVFIVGNKNELGRKRMVEREAGSQLANSLNCSFYEVSVRESSEDVCEIFENLFREHWRAAKLRSPGQKAGKNSKIEVPAMPINFSPLPNRRRNKTFKHVDKIPRLMATPKLSRSDLPTRYSQPVDYQRLERHPAPLKHTSSAENLPTVGAREECSVTPCDPRKAAEEFVRKTLLLNITN